MGGLSVSCLRNLEGFVQKRAWVYLKILNVQIETLRKFRFMLALLCQMRVSSVCGELRLSYSWNRLWAITSMTNRFLPLFAVTTWSELGQCPRLLTGRTFGDSKTSLGLKEYSGSPGLWSALGLSGLPSLLFRKLASDVALSPSLTSYLHCGLQEFLLEPLESLYSLSSEDQVLLVYRTLTRKLCLWLLPLFMTEYQVCSWKRAG